jgi:CRP-like cAMP-binding protein
VNDHTKTLSQALLFRGLDEAGLTKLASIARERTLANGAWLCHEGDAGDAMYVIALGTVLVLKRDRAGKDQEVATLGSSSSFGEMALVLEDEKRAASVIAKEATSILELSRHGIEKLCAGDDRFAHTFYKALASGLASRLRSASGDVAQYRTALLGDR